MSDPIVLPSRPGAAGLGALLRSRRSSKSLDPTRPLGLDDVAAVLWAASGTTGDSRRVSPSARASHPLAVTLAVGRVDPLAEGAYRYRPVGHTLERVTGDDVRPRLAAATLDAGWLRDSPAVVVLSCDLRSARDRFADQPPEHGERFAWLEAGHASQNVYLAAAERGLGTCLVAGLDDRAVALAVDGVVPERHEVLGVLPLGHPRVAR